MRNAPSTLAPVSASRRRSRQSPLKRGAVLSLAALALGMFLLGCSFLQPDFSQGRQPPAQSGLEAPPARVSPVAADVSAATAGPNAAAMGGSAPGQASQPTTASAADTSQDGEPASQTQESGSPLAVETGRAGPLSNLFGGNLPGAETPGQDGAGSAQEQLGGLTPLDIVAAQDQVIRDIYDSTISSVVSIRISRKLDTNFSRPNIPDIPGIPEDFFERSGGTGFVWDARGHIVTNHHVVAGADRILVGLRNGIELEGEFVASDPDSDLAVVKVSDPDGWLAPVTVGDSNQVHMGQMAAAVGNPFGQDFSITSGIISGINRTIRSGHSPFSIPEVLQTDAPINPGNSGGPLMDRNGHVIGVNTQIISRSGVNSGIGFAVPINIAKLVVPALIEDGEYRYSWLGISGGTLRPDTAEAMDLPRMTRGALVMAVVPDGPAQRSGLEGSDDTLEWEGLELPIGGDVIVAIDGSPIETIDDVIAFLVSNTVPNQEVTVDIIRDGQRQQLTVRLGTRPDLARPR